MATQDLTDGTGFLYDPVAPIHVLKKVVDLSTFTAAAQDVLQVLAIPAGTFVQAVHLKVLTASGGTLTADVGDGADADGWLVAANLNTTTDVVTTIALSEGTPNTIGPAYAVGKLYTSADTIDVTLSNNAPGVVGKFLVEAICIPLGTSA